MNLAVAPVRPRQVFCPIEDERRDLVAAADALAGRFRHAGVTLDLGLPPDWRLGGLADDEEWHIEWSKFYVGLDLAHAFTVTADPAYVECWKRLVESWIDQQPAHAHPSDVTARRLQNWLYAWQGFDRCAAFTGLDRGFEERLLTSMSAQLDHVTEQLTPERNHRTLELYALLVVSLGLPALDPEGCRAERAWAALQENLLTDVWPDGVHRERSTHYHLIALRSFVGARVNVLRFGGVVPTDYDERLRAACRFGMHVHRPDGLIPALSDSDSGSYLDLLHLAGRCLDLPDLTYVATGGREGVAPTERHVGFDVGGYYVQRSGWGDRDAAFTDERFLVLGCGPLGDGGHGHYDALAVEAHAHGHPLVVDPGRFTYAEGEPNWRRWFKGTAAHNTVTVDGLDQQPYRRGKPKGEQMAGRLLERAEVRGLHLLRGEVTSPAYDAVHRRTVVMVADEYWVVHDELCAPGEHDYALRWHLADDAAPDLHVRPDGVTSLTTPTVSLDLAGGPTTVESGWVSSEYGVRTPAPVVRVSGGPGDADLLSVLSGRVDGRAPVLRRADPRAGVAVVVSPDGRTDHLGLLDRGHPVAAGGLEVVGAAVWLRLDPAGDLERVAVRCPVSVRWTGSGAEPDLSADGGWHVWSSAGGPR